MLHFYKKLVLSTIRLQSLDGGAASDTPIRNNEISRDALDATAQSKLQKTKDTLSSMDRESTVAELEAAISEIHTETQEATGQALLDQVVENYIHNNPGLQGEFEEHFWAVDFDSSTSILDTRAFGTQSIQVLAKHGISQDDVINALNKRLQASGDTIASEDIAMNTGPVEMNADLKATQESIQQAAKDRETKRQLAQADTDIPVMEQLAISEAEKEAKQKRNDGIAEMAKMEQGYADSAEALAEQQNTRTLQEMLASTDITNLEEGEETEALQTALNKVISETEMQEELGKSEIAQDGIPGKNTKKAIQIALNKIGQSNLQIDGKIGNLTLAAQQNIDLDSDTMIAEDFQNRIDVAHTPINEDTGKVFAEDFTEEDAEGTV